MKKVQEIQYVFRYNLYQQSFLAFVDRGSILNMYGGSFQLSVKVMKYHGADVKLLKFSPNVNADIKYESLLKVD